MKMLLRKSLEKTLENLYIRKKFVILATKLSRKVPDLSKVKEGHDLFKANENEKILKQPKIDTQLTKIIEKSKIIDVKPATKEPPKTATKLSKPIKQSETITQPTKTVENPKIVDIKSIIIKHKKNCFCIF